MSGSKNFSGNKKLSGKVITVGKFAISLSLITYLIWVVEWDLAIETVKHADIMQLIFSPIFWILSLLFAAIRWRYVLVDSNVFFPLRKAYFDYMIGAFYNVLLPSSIGGDAVRIGLCVNDTKCKTGIATASVLIERVSGVIALLTFLLLVSLFSPTTWSTMVAIKTGFPLQWIAILLILLIGFAFISRFIWLRWISDRRGGRLLGFIYSGAQAFGTLKGGTILITIGLSVLFQGIRIIGMFFISRALHLSLPLTAFFAVVPIVYLATLLPVSLGGLGVREASFAFLLAQFNVSASDTITLSFLVYLNQVFIGILGWFVQVIRQILKTDN